MQVYLPFDIIFLLKELNKQCVQHAKRGIYQTVSLTISRITPEVFQKLCWVLPNMSNRQIAGCSSKIQTFYEPFDTKIL